MSLEAVIFDFDGTLMDLKLGENPNWKEVRKEIADFYNKNGIPASVTFRYTFPFGLYIGVEESQRGKFSLEKFSNIQKGASELIKEKYEDEALKNAERINNSLEALKWIKEKNMKIGVVSLNSEEVIKKAAKKGKLDKHIDAFFGRDSPGRAKPAEDQIKNCLKQLDSAAKSTLMVGDSPSDVEAANQVGIPCIALVSDIYSDEELLQNRPYCLIKNLQELKKIIKKFKKPPPTA